MYVIYSSYTSPSGTRVYHNKIIIYEAVRYDLYDRSFTFLRKFELTRKGWKTSKYSGTIYSPNLYTLSDMSTLDLRHQRTLVFADFDTAYAAKCLLINRVPEIYLDMITTLTARMNSLKSVTPDQRHMSDAIPELFI